MLRRLAIIALALLILLWAALFWFEDNAGAQSLPLAAQWEGRVLHITITNPAPARCLELSGGGKLDTFLPDSCGVTTYDLPLRGGDANYAPAGRTLRLVDTGNVVYELAVPGWVVRLPWVARSP
jgi:hypothetical protein